MKPNLSKLLAIVVTSIAILLCLRFCGNRSADDNATRKDAQTGRDASGTPDPHDSRPPERRKPRPERVKSAGGEIGAADLERWLAGLKGDTRTIAEANAIVGLLNHDPELIRKALEMDPNNPMLLRLGVNSGDFSDGERIALAERFFKQDPDNALAAYMYAARLFKSGDAEKALEILGSGAERQRMDDYNARMGILFEESFAGAGMSRDGAKLLSIANLSLPYMSDLFSISDSLNDSAKASSPPEAAKINALSAAMAKRLGGQAGSRTIIAHLAGLGLESKTLAGLPDNAPSPYAGLTVAEARESIAIESENLKESMRKLPSIETLLPGNPELTNGYVERFRELGEAEALKWLLEQTGGADR